MQNRELRAVVVGTGFGVLTHLRALRAAGIDVKALVGRNPEKTVARASKAGVERGLTSLYSDRRIQYLSENFIGVISTAFGTGLLPRREVALKPNYALSPKSRLPYPADQSRRQPVFRNFLRRIRINY